MNDSEAPHVFTLRVYYEDTDAGGVVYYANYFKFAERARTELLRQGGVSHRQLAAGEGTQFVVRRVEGDFISSARLDDALEVRTRVVHCSGARMTMDQTVRRDDTDLVHLVVQLACVNADGRAARIPEEITRRFVAMQGAD